MLSHIHDKSCFIHRCGSSQETDQTLRAEHSVPLLISTLPSFDPSLTLLPSAQGLGKWHQPKGGLPALWAVWRLSLPCPPSGHSSQLVQALRKALEPALSDISVDWFVPDAVEALLTPREIPALYPGDQLLGYCSLFRVDGFRPRGPGVGLGWGAGGRSGMSKVPACL